MPGFVSFLVGLFYELEMGIFFGKNQALDDKIVYKFKYLMCSKLNLQESII